MSVIRFEPFREFDRLMSMAASATRAPLGMPINLLCLSSALSVVRLSGQAGPVRLVIFAPGGVPAAEGA